MVIGLGYYKTSKLLDSRGFTPTLSATAFARLLLKLIAECRGAKSFAYIIHESDHGFRDRYAVAMAGAESINELFQAGAGMAFPK
jgi:hypothetical protein